MADILLSELLWAGIVALALLGYLLWALLRPEDM